MQGFLFIAILSFILSCGGQGGDSTTVGGNPGTPEIAGFNGWETPIILDTGFVRSLSARQNSQGFGVIAWTKSDSQNHDSIWIRFYSPTTGWAQPVQIINVLGYNAFNPKVFLTDNNTVIIGWTQQTPSANSPAEVFTGVWTPDAELITTPQVGVNSSYSMDVSSQGNIAISYTWHILGFLALRTYTPNSGWKYNERIDDSTNSSSVHIENDGVVSLVWLTGNFGTTDPYYFAYGAIVNLDGGVVVQPLLAPNGSSADASIFNPNDPQILPGKNGSFSLILRFHDASRTGLFSRSFTPGIGWGDLAPVSQSSSSVDYYIQRSSAKSGFAIALWKQNADQQYYNSRSTDLTWGIPRRFIAGDGLHTWTIAVNSNKKAIAAGITDNGLYVTQLDQNESWINTSLVATPGSSMDSGCIPWLDETGRLAVLWIPYDSMGKPRGIFFTKPKP